MSLNICKCGNEFEATAEEKLLGAIFSEDICCSDCFEKLKAEDEFHAVTVNGVPLEEYLGDYGKGK